MLALNTLLGGGLVGKGSNPHRRDIFFSYHLCNCHSVIYEIHKQFFLYILLTIYLKSYVSVKEMILY